ncbi:MAG: hypothetical protein J6Y42_02735 [Bacilli bacterium]|nr:hypothetical protein [Bacilli bacterium]
MYRRFQYGLLSPRLVTDFMRDKMYKPFLQLLLYALLMVIPVVINDLNHSGLSATYKNLIVSSFKNTEIDYEIKDFKLKKTKDDAEIYEANVASIMSLRIGLDGKSSSFLYCIELREEDFIFRVSGVELMKYNYYDFEELQSLEFDRLSSENSSEWDKVFSVCDKVIKAFYKENVVMDGFASAIRYYAALLFLSLCLALTFIFRFKNVINFKVMFKLGAYYTAPFVVGMVLSNLFSLSIFYIIGIVLSIAYAFIGGTEILSKLLNSDRK